MLRIARVNPNPAALGYFARPLMFQQTAGGASTCATPCYAVRGGGCKCQNSSGDIISCTCPSFAGLGQATPSMSDKVVPFIAGMLAWAFFGETIKDALGLGQSAARRGISAVKSKIEPVKAKERRRNPGRRRLPRTWSNKDVRQYEHIKRSELDSGASTSDAKRIAAATVNQQRRYEGRA